MEIFREYYRQNSTTYSQQKGRRGVENRVYGASCQLGDEGDAFDDHECWRKGTYHKKTMF